MRIYLTDHKSIKVTFKQIKIILTSGLMPNEWTAENIQKCLMDGLI